MVIRTERLTERHYGALFEIARRAEPFSAGRIPFTQYAAAMAQREGIALAAEDGRLIGCVSFSDYCPEVNIVIHCTIAPEYQRRWVSRGVLRSIAGYVYGDLGLPRMTAVSIVGRSDEAGEFLKKLGFVEEGVTRKGVRLPDGAYCDVKTYGMLREECRWR